ncbi:endonuclease V isoform X2 [Lithobates pipiens]
MAEAPSSQQETLVEWEKQQILLKDQLITTNTESWQQHVELDGLKRVGGVDLSYIKGNDTVACASLVVLSYPEMEVLLVDGNGILHHRGFGVACHLGILTDLPTIGVAKNLLQVDGLENNEAHKEQAKQLEDGDYFHLKDSTGHILGAALKSCKKSSKPIYVSVGHKISLETAVNVVHSCCKFRVPEPTRQADIRSREFCIKITNKGKTDTMKPQDSLS